MLLAWLLLLHTGSLLALAQPAEKEGTCAWNDVSCYQDPHLKEITVDLGTGTNETFLAYHPSDVSTFYQEEPGSRQAKVPSFHGQFGKFINLSPNPIIIYWSSGRKHNDVYIAEAAAFEAAATATFPGHKFLVRSKTDDDSADLQMWTITAKQVLYTYDPFEDGTLKLTDLKPDQLELYNLQKNNLKFAEQYKAATGVDYLSLYPRRPRPTNPMWAADYFGQQHSVMTRETHFTELPNPENLVPLKPGGVHEPMLKAHREEDTLNMTMTVLSCAPRVFEIKNFLSKVEIDHIMQIATGMTLHQSSTKAGLEGESRHDESTRTSRNSWVVRGKSPIIDAIYRRSADLMQVNEAYMRKRSNDEMPHLKTKGSNSEQLQLVHYDVGQQYTPHHDFAIPSLVDGQPMRFATILFYLNEGMGGGATTFPKWRNAEHTSELKVVPEVGKAVLFYSLLPDGNMDELSQHAAQPVSDGEKWLINLWTWDPMMRF
eukprot:CAMPEP_0119007566 /NCGR_PEP_ID=MMETSP1176-20130426/3095_1 /TAXON_ID=265551 /ORGANISM="Synedropsis recta cf, Strain CCMP1620" /LENGTH=485 /DNA_ID=CAMNT_0006959743 /DNA_START=52 /DNA_END=1512 /DNA_ORIENTATION=-